MRETRQDDRHSAPRRWRRPAIRAAGVPFCAVCWLASVLAPAATIDEAFEGPATSWTVAESDVNHRVVSHSRSREAAHRGASCERFVIEASAGTTLRLQTSVGEARVIDEWKASLWVRADRPDIRLSARVRLPNFIAPKTGQPVDVLVPGSISKDSDRWELLEVAGLTAGLKRQLLALRAEHGPAGDLSGAIVTHVVLELYSSPGRYDVAIDDLLVHGSITTLAATPPPVATTPPAERRDPAVVPAQFVPPTAGGPPSPAAAPPMPAAPAAATGPTDPASGINRGVLEVAGLPFFPRALDHNGEPLETIAALGFNCVRLPAPASSDLLAEARRSGVWVICPPPLLPDVDIRDPESVPVFSSNWDRVLLWDMGAGLAEGDVEAIAERARRVRACDLRGGRGLVASADSGLRSISRHVDMLVARRTVLGTSLELDDYLTWLKERPRLSRPGTPIIATLSTELDPRTARQAAALSGIGARGLAVDPESLTLAAFTAVAAGSRGILFASSRRIDGDDREARARAAAARAMNLKLKLLEPWAAAGRYSATAQASDPEVKAVVVEAARARMVLVWRGVQGSQVVARHYAGDLPNDGAPLTLLVPGVPEAHQAWEVHPGGLRPARQRRVTGGVSIVIDGFRSSGLLLLSGEPAVTGHVQERAREVAPLALTSARAQAAIVLADGAELLARLPPSALGHLPAAAMLGEAQRSAAEGESLAATDPAAALARFDRAAAIGGQFERLTWERGVVAIGSLVAGPLATSDATLAEHWRFIDALGGIAAGDNLLPGGGMERIEDLAGSGWRHFALPQADLRTAVEITRGEPAGGKASLRMRAEAVDPASAPDVVETPPVWITTPPLQPPTGKLLEIEARVWVPQPIKGSVDGLLVFDSLGGPALAERVAQTSGWRRLVLYRIVPADATGEPFTLTFALTGIGEARVDEVSVRVLDRMGGVGGTLVSTTPPGPGAGSFPKPGDMLGPGTIAAPLAGPATPRTPTAPNAQADTARPLPAVPQWPGMNLEWPKLLPFSQPSNAPPPGPGGGRVDPFKRARPQQP
ncbi:MAG: hypothetical protein WCR51_07120 [Planctomycetia bacterium]